MPLPEMDVEGKQTEVTFGPITVWFGNNGFHHPVAFRVGDDRLTTLKIDSDQPGWKSLTKARDAVPHSRFVEPVSEGEFEAAWERETDKYLYPKRVGKLRQDWVGFGSDVPLDILADYLADHGMEEAARVLRAAASAKVVTVGEGT